MDGNWATHVFIAVPRSVALDAAMVDAERALAARGGPIMTRSVDAIHISLSRTFPIRKFQQDALLGGLADAVRAAAVDTFSLTLSGYECFENDERTRSFLSLQVVPDATAGFVLRLIEVVCSAADGLSVRTAPTATHSAGGGRCARQASAPDLLQGDAGHIAASALWAAES